ncbi:MAG: exodeoxyribonuclease VII small subunit [Bacteroidales bacterium]|nr:exodeoxyribonuclease VII small subunit [Bacteroidales bacterium]
MIKDFDYKKALDELEAIAKKVEDTSTGLDDIDKYIMRADELIASCREYLRSARERLDGIE